MTTELALSTPMIARDIPRDEWEMIRLIAPTLHEVRLYDGINSPTQAIWRMARAYELGFPITAAPEAIESIQGRLSLKPQAAWALVLRSGLLEDMKVDEQPDSCEILFKRVGQPFWLGYKFTLDGARKAGLVKQDGAYEKWLPNMLYWRAMGFAIDRVFPDVTLGLKDSLQWGGAIPEGRAVLNTPAGEVEIVADGSKPHVTVIDRETGEVLS